MRKLVGEVVDALKSHPLALALVVVNLMFLVAGVFVLLEVAKGNARTIAMLADLARSCSK